MDRLDSLDIGMIRAAFNRYDMLNTGYITRTDFIALLGAMGDHDREFAVAMFHYSHTAGNYHMPFSEFCHWWISGEYRDKLRFPKSRQLLKEAYAIFGVHASTLNSMDYGDFRKAATSIGRPISDELFDTITDESGTLTFKLFWEWLSWF